MKRTLKKTDMTGYSTTGTGSLMQGLSQTRTYLNGTVQAKRVVIAGEDVAVKTDAHPLNPRNQDALTKEAVRDIIGSIAENGVNVEGVAVKCHDSGKLLLLDASRRRFCCIETVKDLPVWELQGDISDEQALAIINDSQEVKRWSYPEHARYLQKVAERKALDMDSMKIEELAKALSIGRESLRKRIEALNVDSMLKSVFPDYEGIPNAFYSRLAKLERSITKAKKGVPDFIAQFTFDTDADDVSEQQALMMATLESEATVFIGNVKVKEEWKIEPLAKFDDKRVFAKVRRSPDRNTTKFEFCRIEADKMKKIEAYIAMVLNEK